MLTNIVVVLLVVTSTIAKSLIVGLHGEHGERPTFLLLLKNLLILHYVLREHLQTEIHTFSISVTLARIQA